MRSLLVILFSLFSGLCFGQNEVPMADLMRSSGKIYVVVGVLLLVFIGILIFLISIDKKITQLEKEQQ